MGFEWGGYGYGLELLEAVVIVGALGLARREIGRPDLQKPDRRCAYMQSVWVAFGCWRHAKKLKTDEDGPRAPP